MAVIHKEESISYIRASQKYTKHNNYAKKVRGKKVLENDDIKRIRQPRDIYASE